MGDICEEGPAGTSPAGAAPGSQCAPIRETLWRLATHILASSTLC